MPSRPPPESGSSTLGAARAGSQRGSRRAAAVSAHHWQDAAAGISELHRVVATGGRVVVADVGRLGPVLDTLRKAFFRKVEHHRGWDPKELADLLYSAGFLRVRARRERVLGAPL